MSESDIEANLGGPPGDYRTRADVDYLFESWGNEYQALAGLDPVTTREWDTDALAIRVFFGPDGKALLITRAAGRRLPATVSNPVLRMLRDLGSRPVTTAKSGGN
jgi:hypothetical protein